MENTNKKIANTIFAAYSLENTIKCDVWNNSNQRERNELLKPIIENFYDVWKEQLDNNDIFNEFCDILTDDNHHTERRIFERTRYKKQLDNLCMYDFVNLVFAVADFQQDFINNLNSWDIDGTLNDLNNDKQKATEIINIIYDIYKC